MITSQSAHRSHTPTSRWLEAIRRGLSARRAAPQGMPAVEAVDGDAMPEPYRGLLVHQRDMTTTLESFCGERLHLRVLQKRRQGDLLTRQVVLETDKAGRPLEFGRAIGQLAFSNSTTGGAPSSR